MSPNTEVKRKLFHFVLGIVLVVSLYYDIVTAFGLTLIALAVFVLFSLSKKLSLPVVEFLLDHFERDDARNTFPGKGPIFYLLGSLLVLILFPEKIALASILILAVGDSIPNLVGMRFRRFRHPFSDSKYLEGFLAGLIIASLSASIFVAFLHAFLASFAALVIESVRIRIGAHEIDDNLLAPLCAGFVLLLLSFI
jgi:dolichol kinase